MTNAENEVPSAPDVRKRSKTQDNSSRLVRAATISNPNGHAGTTISSTQKSVSKYSLSETSTPSKTAVSSTKTQLKTTTTIDTTKEIEPSSLTKTSQTASNTALNERKPSRISRNHSQSSFSRPEPSQLAKKPSLTKAIENRLAHLYDDTSESDADRTQSNFLNSDRSAHNTHTLNEDTTHLDSKKSSAPSSVLTENKPAPKMTPEASRSNSCQNMCKRHYKHTARLNGAEMINDDDTTTSLDQSKKPKDRLDTFRLRQLRSSKSIDGKSSNRAAEPAKTAHAPHRTLSMRRVQQVEKDEESGDSMNNTFTAKEDLNTTCKLSVGVRVRGIGTAGFVFLNFKWRTYLRTRSRQLGEAISSDM